MTDYTELVKALRCQFFGDQECGEDCPYCGDGCMPGTCACDAADAIEQLTAELEYTKRQYDLAVEDLEEIGWGEWIPATERLPEKGRYLAVCKTIISGEQIARILRFSENLESVDEYDFEGENRSGWYYYDDEYGHIEVDDVTHWMPLPAPPKEATNEP